MPKQLPRGILILLADPLHAGRHIEARFRHDAHPGNHAIRTYDRPAPEWLHLGKTECRFEVALGSHWGGFGVAIGCLSTRFVVALIWAFLVSTFCFCPKCGFELLFPGNCK